jgi:hypothetical protein
LTGVNGRSARHTDQMLAGSYLGPGAKAGFLKPVLWRPAWWTPIKSAGIAAIFLVVAGVVPTRTPVVPQHRPSTVSRTHARAHVVPKPRRVASTFEIH